MPYATTYAADCTDRLRVQGVLFNLLCALFVQIGHRCLYYMLGISQWFFHFVHYFCPFLVLLVLCWLGFVRRQPVRFRDILPISLTQLVVSTSTCIVHSGGKQGALYSLRLSDFAITFAVLQLMPMFCGRKVASDRRSLLIVVAISASLAWLDFGIAETSWFALLALPFYVLSSACHNLITYTTQQKLAIKPHELMLYHFGLTSAMLLPMCLLRPTDGFNEQIGNFFEPFASWKLTDWVVPSCGFIFHSTLTFSKYWIMGQLSPESYLVSRNLKYTLAAYLQWFGVNGGHANVFSGLAKLIALASAGAYFCKRGSISFLATRVKHRPSDEINSKPSSQLTNGYMNGHHAPYMNGHANGHSTLL